MAGFALAPRSYSCDYRKGIILGALRRRPEATECFVLSVNAYPWNWSCWLQLGAMIEDAEEVNFILNYINNCLNISHPSGQAFNNTFQTIQLPKCWP
jgi:hypothetical protein